MTSFPRNKRGDFHCALYIFMMQNTSTRRFAYSAPRGCEDSVQRDEDRRHDEWLRERSAAQLELHNYMNSRFAMQNGSRYSAQGSRFGR